MVAHRSVKAGSMCIACTISALRIVASASSIASICLRFAVSFALRVANSLATLNRNSTTAEATATAPSIGWRSQIRPTKIGTHGASKNAVNPCVAMKFWTCEVAQGLGARGFALQPAAHGAGEVRGTELLVQSAADAM